MSRKKIYTLIVSAFILIFAVLFIGYLYLSGQSAVAPQAGQSGGGVFGTIFSLFNKNGGTDNGSGPLSSTTTVQSDTGAPVVIPRLRQIASTPTAGASFLQRNIASTTVDATGQIKNVTILGTFIRYAERATGHIFETKPDSLALTEISNTTIPKIYEATFTNGGNSVLFRELGVNDVVRTYFGTLVSPQAASSTATSTATTTAPTNQPGTAFQLTGSFLPDNINEISLSPTKDQIFYLQNGVQGTLGITALTNNSKQKQLFSNPLREWLSDWSSTKTITLVTKPSGNVPGFLFFLNSNTGGLTKILGNVDGLTALSSPDLGLILFSASNQNNFTLNVFNPKGGTATGISLKTLPEKCVWSQKNAGIIYCAVPVSVPAGNYPDIWYQGAVSFNDNFWRIDTKTGARALIARPIDLAKANIDAVDLSLDPNENYLMFINKKDLTLWDLLINQPVAAVATSTVSR